MKRFSKHISLLLALALTLSCIFVHSVSAASAVWNGSIYGGEIQGGGTEAAPCLITNAEQLAWVVSQGGGGRYYKLTTDIYLNDVDKVNWSTGEPISGYVPTPWYSEVPFHGTIDGDGHMIYGLYRNDTNAKSWKLNGCALIPCVKNGDVAVLKNVGIDNAYINSCYAAGGFFGGNGGNKTVAIAENCFVGRNVTLCGYDTGAFVGASDGEFHFNNCYSEATTVNGGGQHGLIGDFYSFGGSGNVEKSSITNCFNANGPESTKGQRPGTVEHVYATNAKNFAEKLTAEQMKGTAASGNFMCLDDGFVATSGLPLLKPFADSVKHSWNGLLDGFAGGSGTAEDPYLIENAGQLALAVHQGNANYKLIKDILINDIEQIDWENGTIKANSSYQPNPWFFGTDLGGQKYKGAAAEQQFNGNLDGNGHAVYGLWYSPDTKSTTVGLIPSATSSTIKNLTLSYSYVCGGRFTGALSSFLNGTVSGCLVDNTVTVHGYDGASYESESIGGLIGWSNGVRLENCGFEGTLKKIGTGSHHIYGLIGTSWGTSINAENCFSIGYQPFTSSIGSKNFGSVNEAQNYYNQLYSVKNVYTSTVSKKNTVSYKVGTTSHTYEAFGFTELKSTQIKSEDAFDNMSSFSADVWFPREASAPLLKAYTKAHGDVNGDGKFGNGTDLSVLRKSFIGTASALNSDLTLDGKSNVCDLVALQNFDTFVISALTVPTVVTLDNLKIDNEYVIVYPEGNSNAVYVAELVRKYYEAEGYALKVVSDGTTPAEKEILLGLTNRAESVKLNTENAYSSAVVGKKLVLSAGHDVALEEAVNALISTPFRTGTAPVFSGLCKPASTVTLSSGKTYSYVWGDEFGGAALDKNKWVCNTSNSKMQGFSDMYILDTEDTVKVVDGKLRLSAIAYTDPGNDKIKYAVPSSVHSQGRMEYRYGYAEIRARVPFEKGVWPSFWTQTSTVLGGKQCEAYMVEIDVFEIFGSDNSVVPNMHKWYRAAHDPSTHNCSYNGTHTQSGTNKTYNFSNHGNLDNEYHTYGFEWTPTDISMYVDGNCYKTFDITKSYDACSDMAGFQDPMYVIFNNHFFSPESSYKPNLITDNEAAIPSHYEIDWFRLYQSDSVENTRIWTK